MRVAVSAIAVATTFAVLGVRPAAPSSGALNACHLLAQVIRANPYWSINLRKHTFVAAAGGGWRCELTSVPPKGSVSPAFLVLMTFFASPNARVAHANMAVSPDPPVHGTAADEAFAREQHAGGATTTRVTWRKGRYWGWFSIHGPRLVGDLDDAKDLLNPFVRRVPRT
jgi:hypothetical protein